jgi:diadenosine tetraphosphate (Ap4A) HIT family hydrolase
LKNCLICSTLAGDALPPGGILLVDRCWAFYLHSAPLLATGQGFVALRRHTESLSALNLDEQAALGPFLHKVVQAVEQTLQPQRVHVANYGEGLRHVHFHILPRMPNLPAGNIPLALRQVWYELLQGSGLKRPFSAQAIEATAAQLRAYFEER